MNRAALELDFFQHVDSCNVGFVYGVPKAQFIWDLEQIGSEETMFTVGDHFLAVIVFVVLVDCSEDLYHKTTQLVVKDLAEDEVVQIGDFKQFAVLCRLAKSC